MIKLFKYKKYIYSVDMMIAYINIFKIKYENIKIDELSHVLNFNYWTKNNISYSPLDVINDKKYKKELNEIKNVDLKYPIIIADKGVFKDYYVVIDGVHRLTKAYLNNKKYIKTYILNKEECKKFLIDKSGNYNKVDKMKIYDFIINFYDKFKH